LGALGDAVDAQGVVEHPRHVVRVEDDLTARYTQAQRPGPVALAHGLQGPRAAEILRATAGLVEERTPGAGARAAAAFGWPVAPLCSWTF
ncbi:MAG: hypothetical protein J0I87_12245, partial [Cellulomonas sp.]|nr:hypothetical protein [Cellulomonas sp.]